MCYRTQVEQLCGQGNHLNIINYKLVKIFLKEYFILWKEITFKAIMLGEGEAISKHDSEVYSLGSVLSNEKLNHFRI